LDEKQLLTYAKIAFFIGFTGTMLTITFMPETISGEEFTWHKGTVQAKESVGLLHTYTIITETYEECSSFMDIANASHITYKTPASQCWISNIRTLKD